MIQRIRMGPACHSMMHLTRQSSESSFPGGEVMPCHRQGVEGGGGLGPGETTHGPPIQTGVQGCVFLFLHRSFPPLRPHNYAAGPTLPSD